MPAGKDFDTLQVSSACLGLVDCHCNIVFIQGDHLEMHKSDFYPWSFPSLLALVGVILFHRAFIMLILALYSRVYTFFERCTGDFSEGGMCRQNVVQKWGIIDSLWVFGALVEGVGGEGWMWTI